NTNDVSYGGDLERILGYASEEMVGGVARFMELIHPADRPAFEREIERVRDTGESFHCSYRLRRKDGSYIWVDDRGHFISAGPGTLSRMVGFIENITERPPHYQRHQAPERREAPRGQRRVDESLRLRPRGSYRTHGGGAGDVRGGRRSGAPEPYSRGQ